MRTAANLEPRAVRVEVGADRITATLTDGRVISVPLSRSWRLEQATPEQRANYRLVGDGEGFRWPEIDEDISVEGMLHGAPALRSSR